MKNFASRLNKRITFLKPITTIQDDTQYEDVSFVTYKTVYAGVIPIIGKELVDTHNITNKTNYKINTRYFSDLKEDMRIDYNGKIFEIVSIINANERNEELVITALEV